MTLIVTKAVALGSEQLLQGIFLVFGLIAVAVAVHFTLQRDGSLAIKTAWIAALLLVIAAKPGKLPFLSGDPGTCLFFRNAFAALFAVFLIFNVFVIFWIQLPQERVPRFKGRVIELVNSRGASVPRVEFRDTTGTQNVFDDALSTTTFPHHRFAVGEHVVVRAPTTAPRTSITLYLPAGIRLFS